MVGICTVQTTDEGNIGCMLRMNCQVEEDEGQSGGSWIRKDDISRENLEIFSEPNQ